MYYLFVRLSKHGQRELCESYLKNSKDNQNGNLTLCYRCVVVLSIEGVQLIGFKTFSSKKKNLRRENCFNLIVSRIISTRLIMRAYNILAFS